MSKPKWTGTDSLERLRDDPLMRAVERWQKVPRHCHVLATSAMKEYARRMDECGHTVDADAYRAALALLEAAGRKSE